MTIYMSLDPGTTTGVCVWNTFDGEFETVQLAPEHHKELYSLLQGTNPKDVICERFMYQQRRNVVLDSVEYIGIAKLYCQETNTPYHAQTASQAKRLWTNEKLQRLSLWKENQPHAMDAIRHMLYFITVTLKDDRYVRQAREG